MSAQNDEPLARGTAGEPVDHVTSDDVVRVQADYKESTKQTSELVRYVGFGLIGFFFLVAGSNEAFARRLAKSNETILIFIAFCGCLVIACDYVNLAARTQAYRKLLHTMDRASASLKRAADGRIQFDPRDLAYRIAVSAYNAKQAFAVMGSVALILLFARALAVS